MTDDMKSFAGFYMIYITILIATFIFTIILWTQNRGKCSTGVDIISIILIILALSGTVTSSVALWPPAVVTTLAFEAFAIGLLMNC